MEDKELLEILKQYRGFKIEKEAIDKQMSILKIKSQKFNESMVVE